MRKKTKTVRLRKRRVHYDIIPCSFYSPLTSGSNSSMRWTIWCCSASGGNGIRKRSILKYVIVNTIDCTCCSIIIVVSMLVFSLFFSYGAAFAVVVCDDISKPYQFPRIGYVKRYLIRQRPYFIADFLIRSIIRTRLFNDYLGSLTNTPVIQRLLGCLTITAEQNASIRAKSTKPRFRIACSGVRL